jgi:hypothetical protein
MEENKKYSALVVGATGAVGKSSRWVCIGGYHDARLFVVGSWLVRFLCRSGTVSRGGASVALLTL